MQIQNLDNQEETLLKFNYSVPIIEAAMVNNEFIIRGTAINVTTTSNNHKFLEEELKPAAPSLVGRPLLIDHDNSVKSIKGRVVKAGYSEFSKNISFEAVVKDKEMVGMIKDGLINSVSVGAAVRSVEESEGGELIPRGLVFKELSLVAVPADENATFTYSLKEAYGKMLKSSEPKLTPIVPAAVPTTQSQDIIFSTERGSNMQEQTMTESQTTQVTESAEVVELKNKLALLEKANADFKAKERREAENKYVNLCKEKNVSALDVKSLDEKALSLLTQQVEAMPAKVEVKESTPAKVDAVTEEFMKVGNNARYKIVQGAGSLRGGSYTVERIY